MLTEAMEIRFPAAFWDWGQLFLAAVANGKRKCSLRGPARPLRLMKRLMALLFPALVSAPARRVRAIASRPRTAL